MPLIAVDGLGLFYRGLRPGMDHRWTTAGNHTCYAATTAGHPRAAEGVHDVVLASAAAARRLWRCLAAPRRPATMTGLAGGGGHTAREAPPCSRDPRTYPN